uniref:Uncharacterized protein n=1 Tax=Salix viminalis TaxID=40686 RepID=A0A6N2L5T9_SALVM
MTITGKAKQEEEEEKNFLIFMIDSIAQIYILQATVHENHWLQNPILQVDARLKWKAEAMLESDESRQDHTSIYIITFKGGYQIKQTSLKWLYYF